MLEEKEDEWKEEEEVVEQLDNKQHARLQTWDKEVLGTPAAQRFYPTQN